MKKIFGILSLGILAFLSFNFIQTVAAGEYTRVDSPELGSIDPTADFSSGYFSDNTASRRIDEKSVELVFNSGWGVRGHFENSYNITDFAMEIDVSLLRENSALSVIFGPQSSYPTAGAGLTIEVIKHPTVENNYLVAISDVNPHNVSFEELVGGDAWIDPNWTGINIFAMDDIISVTMIETGTNYIFTVNGTQYTIPTATLFANGLITDPTSTFISVGIFNNDGTVQSIIFNKLEDAYRRDYYSPTGQFSLVETALSNYEASLLEDLEVNDNVLAAQVLKNLVDFTNLYQFDQRYFVTRYDDANETLLSAEVALGPITAIAIGEMDVVNYETSVLDLTTISAIEDAFILKSTSENKIISLRELSDLTVDNTSAIDALEVRINIANDVLNTALAGVIDTQIATYETAVDVIATLEELNNARILKAEILSYLIGDLPTATADAFTLRITEAYDEFLLQTSSINDDWIVGDGADVLIIDNIIHYSGIGPFTDALPSDGSGLFYTKEAFDITNFTMTINIDQITSNTGGWFSFGIMVNSAPFILADDTSVQDNMGLFFLIIPQGNGTAKVEVYQCSLYSNRFFDSLKTETLTIDLTQDIEIIFGTEPVTLAGVEEEYITITIGGQKMVSDLIKISGMRTSLGVDNTGYLYFGSGSGNIESPTMFKIILINGENPTSDNLVADPVDDPSDDPIDDPIDDPNDDITDEPDEEGMSTTTIIIISSVVGVLMVSLGAYFIFFKKGLI